MKRNMQKAVQDYQAHFDTKHNKHGVFVVDDIYQVFDMSKASDQITSPIDPFLAVSHALEAGFALGYRTAQREFKQAQRAAKANISAEPN